MPVYALLIALSAALLLINDLIFLPLYLTNWPHLPNWIAIAALVAIFAWVLGD